jgi:stage II sporulation protein D
MRLACNTGGPAGSTIAAVPVAASAPILGVPELAPAVERPPMLPEITRSTRVVSSDIQIAIAGDRAIITGRGFGHGVGLCQYCAKGFAERGDDWRTMIERFYPGARIVPLY